MDSRFKREIMLEHYQNPVNRGLIEEEGYLKINTRSDSCVDQSSEWECVMYTKLGSA